jgi:hypothetical protein
LGHGQAGQGWACVQDEKEFSQSLSSLPLSRLRRGVHI